MFESPNNNAGCIIIGRNEGERLVRCLASVCDHFALVVYVDSGSTDNSVKNANEAGAQVLQLDMEQPFTAARARNAGLKYLIQQQPSLEYVQFIDGDCELICTWPNAAVSFLSQNPDFAIVCGRRRERFPDSTTYNALCDLEWNTPIGEASACGGDALMRISALNDVHAYNPALIAGEEPEMCHRLRMKGWKIYRLDEEMTLHDAAITQFSQWWKRGARGGYAYFSVYWLHRKSDLIIWKRNVLRILFWALILPLLMFISLLINQVWLSSVLLLYPLIMLKIYISRSDLKPKIRAKYAFLMVLVKFAELQGGFKMFFDQLTGSQAKLMEYK